MELTWQTFAIVCPLVFLGGFMDAVAGGGGIITLPADTLLKLSDFPVGTRLRILPNHACPTAAPYEKLLLVNGEGRITEALDHVRGW